MTQIALSAVEQLEQAGRVEPEERWSIAAPRKPARMDAELARKLFEVLRVLGAPELRAVAVLRIIARPDFFDPVAVLVPALPLLPPFEPAAPELWQHCAQFILQRSELSPEAPRDWHQEEKLSCTCADCRELQAFVSDPVEQIHRFRMRMDRREHLEQTIVRQRLDMARATDRETNPQTLVCTKTRQIYRTRCDQYRQDVLALQTLAEQADRFAAPAETMGRIRAACVRKLAWKPE